MCNEEENEQEQEHTHIDDTIKCCVCGWDSGISVDDSFYDMPECPKCLENSIMADIEREETEEKRTEERVESLELGFNRQEERMTGAEDELQECMKQLKDIDYRLNNIERKIEFIFNSFKDDGWGDK